MEIYSRLHSIGDKDEKKRTNENSYMNNESSKLCARWLNQWMGCSFVWNETCNDIHTSILKMHYFLAICLLPRVMYPIETCRFHSNGTLTMPNTETKGILPLFNWNCRAESARDRKRERERERRRWKPANYRNNKNDDVYSRCRVFCCCYLTGHFLGSEQLSNMNKVETGANK